MPKYLMRKVVKYASDSAEDHPADLHDANGKPFVLLGQWPAEPLTVTAPDEDAALDSATHSLAGSGQGYFLNNLVSEARYQELRRQPRANDPSFSAVIEMWLIKEEGAEVTWRGVWAGPVRLP
jgi:hypothetical protein